MPLPEGRKPLSKEDILHLVEKCKIPEDLRKSLENASKKFREERDKLDE